MTLSEINNIADLLTAAGRKNVPVPISEWREWMATRIGKATIKDGKVRPVVKRTVSQKIAGTKKADRVVKGLRKNRAASKARAAK